MLKYGITVDTDFKALIPPMSAIEFDQLELNIQRDGCLEPLYIWETDGQEILLDGHSRLAICEKHGRDFTRIAVGGLLNRWDATLWILEKQLGRRNLTDDQRAILWDKLLKHRSRFLRDKQLEAARAAKDGGAVSAKLPDTEKRDQRKEVAAEAKLPESKLRSAREVSKKSPALAEAVLAGKVSLRGAKKKLKAAAPALLANLKPGDQVAVLRSKERGAKAAQILPIRKASARSIVVGSWRFRRSDGKPVDKRAKAFVRPATDDDLRQFEAEARARDLELRKLKHLETMFADKGYNVTCERYAYDPGHLRLGFHYLRVDQAEAILEAVPKKDLKDQ